MASLPLALTTTSVAQFAYMVSALLLIFGLKRLSGVRTAKGGNRLAALGMGIAVAATLWVVYGQVVLLVLLGGLVVGTIIGIYLAAKTPMTQMPELVAFFNGLGGAASALVALSQATEFPELGADGAGLTIAAARSGDYAVAMMASVLIGSLTLSGSLIAYGKLAGKVKGQRLFLLGSQPLNALLAVGALIFAVWAGFYADSGWTIGIALFLLTAAALKLGIGLVVPIGGADMPVVISLLNSYSGLAACATGFVLQNNLLIVAGSLVGASGLILTRIMCKAMNRSLANVIFGGFGQDGGGAVEEDSEYTGVKSTSAEEVASILESARSVIVVPGYGLAVAQAQHKVKELADLLGKRDCEVRYGIHPVAGRMPGHMNVLLAEADVPYEQLFDLDQINSEFANADVAIVIGANDVCNPAAVDEPKSPIAGMPVLNVWDAQTVIVIKRSLSPGYAGIKNKLFEMDNALMYFGDGKQALEDLVTELKDL